MNAPIFLKDEAASDLRAAMNWYEAQQPGLGNELLIGVEDILGRISENPHQYPMMHMRIRRALVKRFPYAVFFVEQKDRIAVIAILHAHRHPRLWRKRA